MNWLANVFFTFFVHFNEIFPVHTCRIHYSVLIGILYFFTLNIFYSFEFMVLDKASKNTVPPGTV